MSELTAETWESAQHGPSCGYVFGADCTCGPSVPLEPEVLPCDGCGEDKPEYDLYFLDGVVLCTRCNGDSTAAEPPVATPCSFDMPQCEEIPF